jgi:alpha-ribazole phosphatase
MFPNQKPIVCCELRECDFGQFEGKTADELTDTFEYRLWVENGCMGQIPGGESVQAFRERCCNAFEKIVRLEAAKSHSLAFVVHGGVIMAVLERFDARKLDFYAYHIANCACVSFDCKIEDTLTLTVIGEHV